MEDVISDWGDDKDDSDKDDMKSEWEESEDDKTQEPSDKQKKEKKEENKEEKKDEKKEEKKEEEKKEEKETISWNPALLAGYKYTEKQRKIRGGMKVTASENGTMEDVKSDWDDRKSEKKKK